jgi:hypothetical protein
MPRRALSLLLVATIATCPFFCTLNGAVAKVVGNTAHSCCDCCHGDRADGARGPNGSKHCPPKPGKYSGDLTQLVNERLRPTFRGIWFVGGSVVCSECLRLGLADEIRYSILPILIDDGIPFFANLDKDIAIHLVEVKAYKTGTVELRYEVRGRASNLQTTVRLPDNVR